MVWMISGEGCCGLLVPSLSARRCFCGELVTCAKTGYMQFKSIQCLDHCTGLHGYIYCKTGQPSYT